MKNKVPARRPNKSMNGFQMLTKAMTGFFKQKSENQKKNEEIAKILKK